MPYVVLSEVLDEIPKIKIDATTKPDTDDANRIIASIEAQVDAVLFGIGYVVPIVGPKSLAVVKDIVIQGAIAKILRAMFIGVKDLNQVGAVDAWKEYLAKLKALSRPDDPVTLVDTDNTGVPAKETAELSSSFIIEEYDLDRPTRTQVF